MACIENVLGGHGPSPTVVAVDKNGKRELSHDVPLQCPNPTLKDDEDDAETWGHPCVPLRSPFSMPTDLARQQPQCTSERTGSCIPDSSRALRPCYGLMPAVAEEFLAIAGVNTPEGLAGWRQKGYSSINMSPKVSGNPPTMMRGGTRVSNGGTERGGNDAKSYVASLRGQGFFHPRDPQTRSPPYIPTLRSGVVMEVPPGGTRVACKGRLAHVSFPLPGPAHPVGNWPRPIPLPSSAPDLLCSTAHCFVLPRPPSFNPLFTTPAAFPSPPVFGPPLSPYFAHLHSGAVRLPVSLNKESK